MTEQATLSSASTTEWIGPRRRQSQSRTRRTYFWMRRLSRDKLTLFAVLWLALVVIAAVAAPAFIPQDLRKSLAPPELAHPLGFDALGRDVLSRVMQAARISLAVGIFSILLSGVVGVAVGVTAGYRRGLVDDLAMRTVDIQMSIPSLLFALVILYVFGTGFLVVVAAIVISRWALFARVSRGLVFSVRQQPYVESAFAIGASDARIVLQHVLPQLLTPIATLATIDVSRAILLEASLSFLGMGIQPPANSWGLMLAEGRNYLTVAWWVAVWPGVALTLTALCITLLASWLRAVTDPLQGSRALPVGSLE